MRSLLALSLTAGTAAAQPCLPTWQPLFPGGDFDNTIRASVVFNDGAGSALYAGGSFSRAGGVPAGGVAKWTGAAWLPIGQSFNGDVNALHIHDGSLYAAGPFTAVGAATIYSVARWNGDAWVAVGSQQMRGTPRALASAPDHNGDSRLWVGGHFLFLPTIRKRVRRPVQRHILVLLRTTSGLDRS